MEIATTAEERTEEIALPLIPALRRDQILGNSGRESIVMRGPKLMLGQMLRIQFAGG